MAKQPCPLIRFELNWNYTIFFRLIKALLMATCSKSNRVSLLLWLIGSLKTCFDDWVFKGSGKDMRAVVLFVSLRELPRTHHESWTRKRHKKFQIHFTLNKHLRMRFTQSFWCAWKVCQSYISMNQPLLKLKLLFKKTKTKYME